MRLYDLTEQYNTLAEMLEEDADNASLQAMLDGIDGAFDEKVESIVKLMQSKISEHMAIENEAKRLKQRADKMAKEIDWLEHYVESEMLRTGKDKVKSALFNITLANCPPSVNVVDEFNVPEVYFNVKEVRSMDKRTILEQLKVGKTIPGVEIIQRKSLRIK